MPLSPRKNGLTSLFKEVRVYKGLACVCVLEHCDLKRSVIGIVLKELILLSKGVKVLETKLQRELLAAH